MVSSLAHLFLFLHYVFPIQSEFTRAPLLKVSGGSVLGSSQRSARGLEYWEFLGIPYATPPLGAYRFASPVKAQPWKGVLDGTKDSSICVQPDVYSEEPASYIGNEDCLTLNIYKSKQCSSNNLCPLLIWLHGGGFLILDGSSKSFGPQRFMDYPLILITLNFRLGLFGFLTLENDNAPGNLGLRDQSLALSWIQQEMTVLHGNPSQVTLFGQSSGAYSAILQMMSPHNRDKGYFTRIISQSGSPVEDMRLRQRRSPRSYAIEYGKALSCSRVNQLLNCLKGKSTQELQEHMSIFSEIKDLLLPNPWVPYMDGNSNVTKPFIPDYPENILFSGNFSVVPVLIGGNTEEGLVMMTEFFHHPGAFSLFTSSLPLILFHRQQDEISENDKYLIKAIKRFYLPHGKVSRLHVKGAVQMFSDFVFHGKIGGAVQLLGPHTPVYQYQYEYSGTHSFGDFAYYSNFKMTFKLWIQSLGYGYNMRNGYGVSHGDELFLMFNLGFLKEPMNSGPKTKRDQIVADHILNMWINFTRTGIPTPEWTVSKEPLRKIFRIQPNPILIEDPDYWTRIKFYRDIFERIDKEVKDSPPRKLLKSTLSRKIRTDEL